ncbi:hypothetical protein [Asticcacaulis sp. W401b]|uniref:hypothetical protein n=1 Tax=Asticcacaulis sp. W401b TaxID=3388666 RepID=UPI003970F706
MDRLTKEEAQAYRKRLSSWLTLDEADELMAEIGDRAQLFAASQGALQFWREAWCGMSCAQLMHAHRIRLGEDPPDFWLDFGNKKQAFEIVQVQPADLRLGDVFDRYATSVNAGRPVEIVKRSAEQIALDTSDLPADIDRQVRAKCAKRYDRDTILVVEIMHEVTLEADTPLVRTLIPICAPALRSFEEIWLRRGNAILRVSRHSASLTTMAARR